MSIEQQLNEKFEAKATSYIKMHEKLFDAVSASPNFNKNTRSFGVMDAYALGSQIEMYKAYEAFVNENSTAANLGVLPQISLDLIGAVYGLSVAPILTSMQTIDEQIGLIYFKQVMASGYAPTADTNGIAEGDVTVTAKEGWKKSVADYMSESQTKFIAVSSAEISDTLPKGIRPNVMINLELVDGDKLYKGVVLNLSDSGAVGSVLFDGLDATGTFTYATGALAITLKKAPTSSDAKLAVTYQVDFEKQEDIPSVEFGLTSDTVTAEIIGLKEMIGTFKSFQFNKRFGKTASDEALADLAGHLAAAESSKVVKAYINLAAQNKNADGTQSIVTWYAGRPAGVSEYEHRQSFKYALGLADAKIGERAGRGFANRYLAGYNACNYLKALNGFVAAAPNTGVGPHLYGYIDGAPVIRCSTLDGLQSNEIIASYINPTSPFEAPVVTATYMPVFITNTMQVSNNPFQNQRAIASWKAFKPVVKQFVQKIVIEEGIDPNDSVKKIAEA